MTVDPVFISVGDAIHLHADAINFSYQRATDNVRDFGLLESAINRPRNLNLYETPDLPALAATLLWGVVKNHAFFDGNKRTGWLITQAFLFRNGYELPTEMHSTRLVLNVALGRRSIDQVEDWIRVRIRPLDPT